jgi:dTDP-4-dehydrorhamnose 3,5-epimerase-like enzyme
VRGFHGDFYTYKLITCLWGSFDLALLDMRRGPTFKQIEYTPFKANQTCILVPPGVFNCHLGHEDYLLHYKWSHQYDLSAQDTISYKEAFNLPNLIASQRDQNAPSLGEYLREKG